MIWEVRDRSDACPAKTTFDQRGEAATLPEMTALRFISLYALGCALPPVLVWLAPRLSAAESSIAARPNMVCIFADDMGIGGRILPENSNSAWQSPRNWPQTAWMKDFSK